MLVGQLAFNFAFQPAGLRRTKDNENNDTVSHRMSDSQKTKKCTGWVIIIDNLALSFSKSDHSLSRCTYWLCKHFGWGHPLCLPRWGYHLAQYLHLGWVETRIGFKRLDKSTILQHICCSRFFFELSFPTPKHGGPTTLPTQRMHDDLREIPHQKDGPDLIHDPRQQPVNLPSLKST